MIIVAIEDRLVGFNQPRAVRTEAEALRDFKALCTTSPIRKDFILWRLGEFNDKTGEITPEKPTVLEKGDSYADSN